MEKNMATIDQQFVEYIVKTLVNNPEKVAVERTIDERGVLLSLTVDPDDVGRVIGKRGVTAQAIRVLLRALETNQDARFNLKIVNRDEHEGSNHDATESKKEDDEPVKNEEPTEEAEAADDTGDAEEANEDDDEEEEEESSELAEKTRAELADLDDLDI
jgi:predicted RNA-binding protein YlqC (UPF0109 family)